MLKEIKQTSLNRNIPLILKKLTGIGPPSLSEQLLQKVEKIFDKIVEVEEKRDRPGRTNRNYYPYYIYKIFDSVLDKDDPSRGVLYYIYLQSEDTLEKDDLDWYEICKSVPELKARPTNRDITLLHRFR